MKLPTFICIFNILVSTLQKLQLVPMLATLLGYVLRACILQCIPLEFAMLGIAKHIRTLNLIGFANPKGCVDIFELSVRYL